MIFKTLCNKKINKNIDFEPIWNIYSISFHINFYFLQIAYVEQQVSDGYPYFKNKIYNAWFKFILVVILAEQPIFL